MKKLLIRLRDTVATSSVLPFTFKLDYELLKRPGYGYGVYHAALEARALGIPRITAIEFGVAGGYGLIALEEVAADVEAITGVGVDVFGFDLASGMPEPSDYKDMPYIWQKGFFSMDVEKLKSRLKKAELILGNVATTTRAFAERSVAPIGFISFDLDFYSSTKQAFVLLDAAAEKFLPRVFCYFDDVVGDDWELHCEYTGELLAIREFNDAHPERKIAKISGFRHKRRFSRAWNAKMYVLHLFDHPKQLVHVNPRKNWQLRLPS